MINHENSHTSIIERASEYKPPRTISSWFIGRPLSTADAPHQTIGKAVGLAVFASDALSSTAYATQEILVILAAAGTMAYGLVFPISIAIVALLAIVTISYEQTIHAYPDGGGAYIVARDNLGEFPALIAGASLLTDYILTVSVSIASGVAQITSAFPALYDYRVFLWNGDFPFLHCGQSWDCAQPARGGIGPWTCNDHALPDPACLCQWYHSAYRRGGYL
jgi:amino acid transporter